MATKNIEVKATQVYNDTGIDFPRVSPVKVKYTGGDVSVSGIVVNREADGDPNYPGKASYFLPGFPEACLCAEIGGKPFYIGREFTIPGDFFVGKLYLSVNDDKGVRHGNGYADNSGSFQVEITY